MLAETLDRACREIDEALSGFHYGMRPVERGTVTSVGGGVVRMSGLPRVGSEELVEFEGGGTGLVLDLDLDDIGAVLLDRGDGLEAGFSVARTHRVMDVPCGTALLGRVVNPLGVPLDGLGPVSTSTRLRVERPAPLLTERFPVDTPLQTGVKVIDALIPIGRGQRELIVGDRRTGKTSLAIQTVANQDDVVSVYCAIGQPANSVAKVVSRLRRDGALHRSIVVVAGGDDPVGLRFVAPYAATAMAEYFTEQGRDVLIVYDDLTRHARAHRELSLLLRRPPGREAYPGDVFYIHSRLLERSARRAPSAGGGSLTALPIVEIHGENLAAYIPTNLVSITDGQIYLSPRNVRVGQWPAVDVGRSVSRVGGLAQLPAFRSLSGGLRLSYAQFEELERFTRYGARLEDSLRLQLERGRLVRGALRQTEHVRWPVAQQVMFLVAITGGGFDHIDPDDLAVVEDRFAARCFALEDIETKILAGATLSADDEQRILELARGLHE